jgi:hypothetical protein
MAFPTVDTPYGFKPINRFDGMPYAGATNQYPVTSGQAVYNGQVVAFVTGGTVSPVALTSSTGIYAVGIVVGVQYTNSSGQTVQAQYAPASGVTNVIAYVVNDPAAEFKVAVTDASGNIVPVAGTILNSSVGGVTGTGDATTGNIDSSINGSTAATGTNLLFRVTALIPDTTTAAGLYTEVVVKFNGTWHQQLSTVGTAPA